MWAQAGLLLLGLSGWGGAAHMRWAGRVTVSQGWSLRPLRPRRGEETRTGSRPGCWRPTSPLTVSKDNTKAPGLETTWGNRKPDTATHHPDTKLKRGTSPLHRLCARPPIKNPSGPAPPESDAPWCQDNDHYDPFFVCLFVCFFLSYSA